MQRFVLPLLSGQVSPRLIRAFRTGPVLHATPLAQAGDVLGLNLTRGCGHACAFCSVRGAPNYPLGDTVLFANTVELLERELEVVRPRAVHLCPAADPFPPLRPVQELAAEVAAVLAERGIEAWLMTRGEPMPFVLDALARHSGMTRFTVALPTLSPTSSRVLETGAASPERRLALLAELRRRGFAAQVAIDPLIPGVTDTPEALGPLLEALAARGVRSVSAGYLFLRQGIAERLQEELPEDVATRILEAFERGPVLTPPGLAAARFLPRQRRQRGYAALISLASRHGITVKVSVVTNPDFTPPRITPHGPGLTALAGLRAPALASGGP
jgi:DNA repair photolyase